MFEPLPSPNTGLAGIVYRYPRVRVSYLNEKAEEKQVLATGYIAAIFQHEVDHLDGKLFVDKAKEGSLAFLEEMDEEAMMEHCMEGTIEFL